MHNQLIQKEKPEVDGLPRSLWVQKKKKEKNSFSHRSESLIKISCTIMAIASLNMVKRGDKDVIF